MATRQKLKQQYALQDKVLKHISDIDSGSGYLCPSCGSTLIAKRGRIRQHHFAHYDNANCEYGTESSLHLLAKELISQSMTFWIPAVGSFFTICEAKEINIDNVYLEQTLDDIIPDVVLEYKGTKLLVEIYVTHKVDEEKRNKIKDIGISTLEIDLSEVSPLISKEELKEIIVGDSSNKKWVYNKKLESLKSKEREAFYKPIISRGFALHVDYCPKKVRVWNNKPYANVIDDCTGCDFNLAESKQIDDHVLCSGSFDNYSYKEFNKWYDNWKRTR